MRLGKTVTLVPTDLPTECEPEPPEPPHTFIVEAAEAIRQALVNGTLEPGSGRRTIGLSEAYSAVTIAGQSRQTAEHTARWAVKRIVGAGLVEVLERLPAPIDPNDVNHWFPRSDHESPRAIFLRSTPELWRSWTLGEPILGTSGSTVDGPRTGESSQEPQPKPRWNADERTLYFGVRALKRYSRHPAEEQIAILEAFEKEQWPGSVQMPAGKKETLGYTVRDLNGSLPPGSPVRFHRDGTGTGVRWEETEARGG